MRRLSKVNALLALAMTFIILFSSINLEGALTLTHKTVLPPQTANIMTSVASYTFTITGAPSSAIAGQSFSGITVTVYNSNDKVATGFKGCVYFTSTDPKATLPYTAQCEYTFTTGSKGDKGVHTFSGFNLVTAGSQTITVTDVSSSATTGAITVNDASPVSIAISPGTATVTAGSKQTYTATAEDSYGNPWNITSLATWGISTGAGGLWSGNAYTSAKNGTWTVTGSYSSLYAYASLTVNPSSATSITLSPQSATIVAGSSEAFTATASDNYGNTWVVSGSTGWGISSGAGGLWTNNVYSSQKAGLWTVTGTFGTLSASASLNVTHGSAFNITVFPQSATIAAGSPQAFTATANDNFGNTWDVTNSTTWSISSGAGGSFSSGNYTSAIVGIWNVTGTYSGLSNSATLTVGYCLTFKIAITPQTSTLTAGASEAFTATASDIYGNVWDVTSSTDWTISGGAGGLWSGNTYTSSTSGTWTVTGTYKEISDSATLTVNNGSPIKIVIGTANGSVTAGSNVTFTCTAIDSCGNEWDVSTLTSWSINSSARGTWSANIYTSATAGTWTVTGTFGTLFNTYSLTVIHSSPVSIILSPQTSTLTAGSSETFTATASDNYSNNWDVSGATVWNISSGANGLWSGDVYTAAKANAWIVTGIFDGLSGTSSLTVTHGSATSILASPKTSTITAGTTQTFITTAFDNFGNSWDATSSATFQVDPQASGSLSGNIYSSCNAGTWTVNAESLGLTDTASLTVTHSSPTSIDVDPDSASITAGQTQNYNATASDAYGNVWDVTSLTAWNVNSSAGGSWSNNIYTSALSGSWAVTGTYDNLSDYASLTVNHASAVSVAVSPHSVIMNSASTEAFTATASDQYGNQWDVSNSASWNVSSGAGGSWTGSTYTSANVGNWAVTAKVSGLYGTANLTVNHGTALKITITPSSNSITAGQTQTFTATASDSNGNNWDITNSTTWSIDSNAGGSWFGNTYTSNKAGTWIVTGTYSGSSSTTSLTVNDGAAVSINVGPSSPNVIAGFPQTFTATATDSCGNTWDVTSSTVWTIDDGASGTWTGNTCTPELSGTWNVTGTFNGVSKSVFLTVNHSTVTSIQINPYGASVTAGTNETFTATAFDSFGNSWDVTSSTIWDINSGAGGSWFGNVYTAAEAGTWNITAAVDNLQFTATMIVSHGSTASIALSPKTQTINSGSSQAFTATAYDSCGNSWDVTNLTMWNIDANAGGSWSNNVYTCGKVGSWTVTGTLNSLSDTAILTVNHGSLFNITVSPANVSITAGANQTYTATASDSSGNTWDVTTLVAWLATAGAGGNWTGNIYTSSNPGTWIITGTLTGVSGAAVLAVNSSAQAPSYSWLDLNHDGVVNIADILYFLNAYQNFGSKGICDPTCDFNHDCQINFEDLVIFIMAYIAYQETA